jgi:hypothetical protein
MARPRDLAALLGVMAAPRDKAVAWKLAMPPPRGRKLEDYRVGCGRTATPHRRVGARAARGCVAELRKWRPHRSEARPRLRMAEVVDVYLRLLARHVVGLSRETFGKMVRSRPRCPSRTATAPWRARTARHRGWQTPARCAADAKRRRGFFADYDVLLMPVNQVPAIVHDHPSQAARTIEIDGRAHEYFDLVAWIALATALNLPATSMPVGRTAGGLPVGMQIAGPHLEDFTAIISRRAQEVLMAPRRPRFAGDSAPEAAMSDQTGTLTEVAASVMDGATPKPMPARARRRDRGDWAGQRARRTARVVSGEPTRRDAHAGVHRHAPAPVSLARSLPARRSVRRARSRGIVGDPPGGRDSERVVVATVSEPRYLSAAPGTTA